MSTASLTSVDSLTNNNDEYLEIFSIIWLDKDVDVKEYQDTKQRLRSIINHLKIFDDVEKCKQYVEQRPKHDRLVLIVSNELSRQIIPSIHKLRQVSAIYITSTDKTNDEQWAQEFIKVRAH